MPAVSPFRAGLFPLPFGRIYPRVGSHNGCGEGQPVGLFADAARQMAKSDAAPFHDWLASHQPQPPPMVFDRWDDARRLPFPGGPDRTDDLVAVLRRSDVPDAQPMYQIIEVQVAPEPLIFH